MRWLVRLDRVIAGVIAFAQWLALPLIMLLFLQWPLRELLRAYSREANDLGQIFFAVFVAVSVTAATRAGTHLAADTLAHRYASHTRMLLRRLCNLIGLLPWAVFVVVASRSLVVSSVSGLEQFPDTFNPGYFIIKTSLWLMMALMIAQAFIDIVRPPGARNR
jgi:TRAP-type mannitol/chloroaromatic compound transport system permease small subunit